MPRGQQSRGACAFCQFEGAKAAITRHLATCPERKKLIEHAEQSKRKSETLIHLRVQDQGSAAFWLDLELKGSAKLGDIDSYLRAIWLECCGHLSEFSAGGWGGQEIAKSRRVSAVFPANPELTHIYDFGTSSETLLKFVGQREGRPLTDRPIVLMARNQMPKAECIVCGQQAAFLCMECVIEEGTAGTLCEEHAKTHPHDDYGEPVPLVNSPRVGMCGPIESAEPPY
jgi:hypothetical protein